MFQESVSHAGIQLLALDEGVRQCHHLRVTPDTSCCGRKKCSSELEHQVTTAPVTKLIKSDVTVETKMMKSTGIKSGKQELSMWQAIYFCPKSDICGFFFRINTMYSMNVIL